MSESINDLSLLGKWREGDQQAAQQLFDRYVERLMRLARRHLSQRMARRVDPEDVVLSVFRTFFVRAREGQFSLEGPEDLCKLLARMTLIKVLRQVQRHTAAKRDIHSELDQASDEADNPVAQLLDREPDPAVIQEFLDQLSHFVNLLKPQEQQILEMRLQGHSSAEIARQLGTYERKVSRVLERLRALAQQENLAGAADLGPAEPPDKADEEPSS